MWLGGKPLTDLVINFSNSVAEVDMYSDQSPSSSSKIVISSVPTAMLASFGNITTVSLRPQDIQVKERGTQHSNAHNCRQEEAMAACHGQ